MNDILTKRSLAAEKRLFAIIVAVTLLASALMILIRYEQSLDRMLKTRQAIKPNLVKMRNETRSMQATTATMRQKLPKGQGAPSDEALLYSRLDQIKNLIQPTEMNVAAKNDAGGIISISFSLNLPAHQYEKALNAMGSLQTESFPFVTFTGITLEGSASTSGKPGIKLDGVVQMPIRDTSR